MQAALYARVSTEEQVDGYSLDAQRRAFREYCKSKNWTPAFEYVEEGKSAHTDNLSKRPVFKQAIEAAERREYDVLVVHKIDRFSRRLKVTLDTLDKLQKAGVGFVSLSEQMDLSTPMGQVQLALVGAFAQLYSDNLSQETKKGWAERRAQGLYCGLLPFGAMKGEDELPSPDPQTHGGLVLAFQLAAQGLSDRQIAQALTTSGYRTAGNQGNRAFSKDTVRGLLTNRLYLGEIPDGKSGWMKAQHAPLVTEDLWQQAQEMRRRNRKQTHGSTTTRGKVFALTGVTHCWRCKGRVHVAWSVGGRVRLGCYNRAKGWRCDQPSASMDLYEGQIREYLSTFFIPEGYQQEILKANQEPGSRTEAEKQRFRLEGQLKRLRELFQWDDITRAEYVQKRDAIEREIGALQPHSDEDGRLERLADFLANIGRAWDAATQEQRSKLVRCLFEEVWLDGKTVSAVRPVADFEPFFRMNYEDFVRRNNELATRRGKGVANS